MTDIKKAFNTFKKDIKAEGLDLTGKSYMTAKQLQNRTATILICNTIPYEDEIRREIESLHKVLGVDSWTNEEKARATVRTAKTIEGYMADIAKYGTKENEYEQFTKQILSSKAWEKFAQAVGTAVYTTDETKDIYKYLRIMW